VLLVCVMACISLLPVAVAINSALHVQVDGDELFDFPGLAFLATVLGLGITYHFYRFHCWAWFFVAGWLVLGTLPVLAVFDRPCCWQEGERELLIAIGAACFVPLHYLWKRRYDFWVEGQAVRRDLDFQHNGHYRARRSWRDDALQLKMRMAEREMAARAGAAADRDALSGRAMQPIPPPLPRGADDGARDGSGEALRGAGQAG
jgi:hypothetical protein